ncbi:Phospholipase D zeta 1 [Bienertia sinuspersici]
MASAITEHLLSDNERKPMPSTTSFCQIPDYSTMNTPIFEELPKATILSVSRPDVSDITPLLLSYTIELHYKQVSKIGPKDAKLLPFPDLDWTNSGNAPVLDSLNWVHIQGSISCRFLTFLSCLKQFKWLLQKKATQVLSLHISLKKRAIIEEFHEKQEQVKEWLQNLGMLDHAAVVHDEFDFGDDGSSRHHYIPSRAAFSFISPSVGRQQSIADKAKVAMQGYLNHFLGNLEIVNCRQVCKFLEVSKLSFLQEYGPKLKEDYVLVNHLPRMSSKNATRQCLPCQLFGCCSWQKVWAVLKPGFLALLEDPLDMKLLDIIIFDLLPSSSKEKVYLAHEIKSHKPLRYSFKISCGNWNLRLRTSSTSKVKDWVAAINDAVQRPPEGWCHPHRFGSFAPARKGEDGSEAQWFIDGESAFDAIASAIENAKAEIFITGWWLCPELYLRRPFVDHETSRLDVLLESKAKEGVQIYILMYKEVSIALKINSLYSKRRLLNIHDNVRVLRYPDHLATGIYYWSHHEKIVVVDNQLCFIGGLDLCFGRYDTIKHRVGDHPSRIWPGKDYYNPRESEPNSWEDMMRDELDRQIYPRMPWHDVHCAIWGPPCRDVARHFVQRWNYAKKSKAPHQRAIPLLIPRHHMVLPHYLRSTEINIPNYEKEQSMEDMNREELLSPESPELDVPLLLPQDSQVLDASNYNSTLQTNQNNLDWTNKELGNSSSSQDTTVESLAQHKLIDGFLDQLQHEGMSEQMLPSFNQNSDEWWEAQERGEQVDATSEPSPIGPRTSCHCQIIRSVGQWSAGTSQDEDSIHRAYCSLIQKAEHFVYIEGGMDDAGAATVRALMHWQYRTICRGDNSMLCKLRAELGPKTEEFISFYGLRTYGSLCEGGLWSPASSKSYALFWFWQVYVHSKVMIVDDRIALVGSSNINDRSLLGSRDSEVLSLSLNKFFMSPTILFCSKQPSTISYEDTEFLKSSMNGESWMAGKFSSSLRLSLWAEHLGLSAGEMNQIQDPVTDTTYKNLWMKTAQYRYTTIDFGVAPKIVKFYEDGTLKKMDPLEMLKSVKGNVVRFPLEFMRDEDLRPMFHEGEFYTSHEVFH